MPRQFATIHSLRVSPDTSFLKQWAVALTALNRICIGIVAGARAKLVAMRPLLKHAASLWRGLASLALNGMAAATFILAATLLFRVVDDRAISIQPISVPRKLIDDGYTSDIAATRLYDALKQFADSASTVTILNGFGDLKEMDRAIPAVTLHTDVPNLVLPTMGLSLETVASQIRTFFRVPRTQDISGEITLDGSRVRLRLRKNGALFYTSAEVDEADRDELFVIAAPKVFESTQPYLNAYLASQKDPTQGLEAAKRIIADWRVSDKRDKNVVLAHVLIGSIMYSRGRLTDAIHEYNQAIQVDDKSPHVAMAHTKLGDALLDRGELDGSISEYRKALQIDPDSPTAHYGLGSALHTKATASVRPSKQLESEADEELQNGCAKYRNSMQLRPSLAAAHTSYGYCLFAIGKPSDALNELARAIALDPDFAAAYNTIGDIQRAQGNFADAIIAYTRSINIDSRNPAAHARLGLQHYYLGEALRQTDKSAEARAEYQAAMTEFTQATQADDQDANAYFRRGLIYARMQDYKGAIADGARAVAIEPSFGVAQNALCWWRASADEQLELALQNCNKAIELQPNNAMFIDSRAFTYLKLNRLSDARIDYDTTLQLEKDHPSSLYGRGIIKLRTGEKESGCTDLRNALKAEPRIADRINGYGHEYVSSCAENVAADASPSLNVTAQR